MRLRPTAVLAIVALALAGCTQLPRPFQPASKGDNELLELPDHTGVTVAPITGDVPDDGTALAAAMASALRKQNLPASVGSGNRATRWLLGTVRRRDSTRADGVRLALTWELYDRSGARVGTAEQTGTVAAAAWRAGRRDALARLVRPAAHRVAAMIQGRSPSTGSLPGYADGTRLVVGEIRGEPGEAARALAQALARRLRQRDLPLSDRAQPGDIVIEGRLTLGQSNGTNRPMTLVWILRREGESGRMGDLKQANRVPVTEIRKGWDRLAGLITRAAVPGVLKVIEAKAPEGETES